MDRFVIAGLAALLAACGGGASSGGASSGGASSGGASSGGASSGGASSGGASSGGASSGGGSHTGKPCDEACTGTMLCDDGGACVCAPGFEPSGSDCVASAVSAPTTRSKAEVCARYASERSTGVTEWSAGTGGECDPGLVPYAGQVAALRYLNLYRWMLGVGPVQVLPKVAQGEQECAAILQYTFSHSPPTTAKCYTPDGAAMCADSLIASGFGLVGQVDGYALEVNQNLIHRRNVLSVGRAGVWFGATGGASAMHYGGSYPALATDPAFVAHPGPGPNVRALVPNKWFVQRGTADTPPLDAKVFVAATGEEKPMKTEHHFTNFSSFDPDGWAPANDVAYRVELVESDGRVFASYETTFVTCP